MKQPRLLIGPLSDFQSSLRHVLTLRKNGLDEYLSIVLFQFPKAPNQDEPDRYSTIVSSCPHLGAPLENAEVEIEDSGDAILVCPWHSYDFNLATGESSTGMTACTWAAIVEDNRIYLENLEGHTLLNVRPVSEAFPPLPSLGSLSLPETKERPTTITDFAHLILMTPDPREKVALTRELSQLFRTGQLTKVGNTLPPDVPPQPKNISVISPGQGQRRGKGGSLRSRIALLHSLANIEQAAINLAVDIIARFAKHEGENMPLSFFADFLKVAEDEAKHFSLLQARLEALGSFYGALPIHSGLWQSATETSHSLISRLCIIHMVHEARGLDVNPQQIAKVTNAGDLESAETLTIIHQDEITHVQAGHKWLTWLCAQADPPMDPIETFRSEVRAHFHGALKPPFNVEDRAKAGLSSGYYENLVSKSLDAVEDSRHIQRAAAGG